MEGDRSILQAINPAIDESIFLNALVAQDLGGLRVDYPSPICIIEALSHGAHSLCMRGARRRGYCGGGASGHSPVGSSSMHRSEIGAVSIEDSIKISLRMTETIVTRGIPVCIDSPSLVRRIFAEVLSSGAAARRAA